MLEKKERTIIGLAISISAIILAVVVILAVLNKQPAEQSDAGYHYEQPLFEQVPTSQKERKMQPQPPAESTDNPNQNKISLNNIIKAARTWGPAYTSWSGRTAPDFTSTDIVGKQHKLSDYRGKNVMIIFWATWCRPCLMEIPHLIELRNTISEDKLAMLAISNENPALVKKFVANRKIDYTVLLNPADIPAPYSMVGSIPSSFFIDAEGKIKLGTVGVLSLDEIKAILQAE